MNRFVKTNRFFWFSLVFFQFYFVDFQQLKKKDAK